MNTEHLKFKQENPTNTILESLIRTIFEVFF